MDDVARRTTLRLVAGLTVGAALLGGCAQAQQASENLPSAAPEAEPSDAELPPLGPADLPMPDEARTQDAAGAEAFVRYYIDLINRTSTVMDAAPLREFSNGCAECNRIATETEQDAQAGYRYQGGKITITWIKSPPPGSEAEIGFVADQEALSVLDTSGAPVQGLTFPAYDQLSSGASARWHQPSQTWILTGLTLG
ncbi:DUF6318 family protein [Geodermatophilus sp. SYSU D00742]